MPQQPSGGEDRNQSDDFKKICELLACPAEKNPLKQQWSLPELDDKAEADLPKQSTE